MARARRKELPPDCLDRSATGLQTVLPYWHIQDGAVHLSDGSVEIAFELKPPPFSSLGPEGIEYLYDGMRTLLNTLGHEGERIRLIYEVAPAGAEEIVDDYRDTIRDPTPVLRSYGERRAAVLEALSQQKAFYRYRFFLTVRTSAPRSLFAGTSPVLNALSSFLPFLKKRKHVPFLPEEYLEWLQRLEALRSRIRAALAVSGIAARDLEDAELFALIFSALNPDKPVPDYQPPVNLADPNTLDDIDPEALGSSLNDRLVRSTIDNRDLAVLRIGSVFHRVYQLSDIPIQLTFGALQNTLFWVDPPYRAVLDFTPLPPEKTRAILSRIQGDARAMQRMAVEGDLDPGVESEEAIAQAREMMRYLIQTGEYVFKVSGAVILSGSDEHDLYRRHNELLSASAREIGTPLLPIEKGALRPYLAALPLNGETIPYQKLYVASDAIKYAAYQAPWVLKSPEPREVYITRWNVPIGFNAFKQPGLYNYNALIVGTAGSGKSFFAQMRLLEYLKSGDAIAIAIDKDRLSYDGLYRLFAEQGLATRLELSSDADVVVNPFDLPKGAVEPDDMKLYFLEALLTTMEPLSEDPAQAAVEAAVLEAAIKQAYQNAIEEDYDEKGNVVRFSSGVTMSDFVRALENLNTIESRALNPEEKKVANTLATRFRRWTKGHPRGRLFDGESTFKVDENTRFVYFILNMQETEKQLLPIALLIVTDLAWRISLQSRYRHKLVVFEEAWSLVENPASAKFVHEFFRAGRKRNVSAIAISQALEDFTGEHAAALANNVSHLFYFRTADDRQTLRAFMPSAPARLFEMLGGTTSERYALMWLKGDQEGGDVIAIQADPLSYWVFTSKPDDLEKRRALERELGSFSLAVLVLAGELTLEEARRQAAIEKATERGKKPQQTATS